MCTKEEEESEERNVSEFKKRIYFKKKKDSQIKVKSELMSGQITPDGEETTGFGKMRVISET